MSNRATFEEKCAELDANDKKTNELLEEARRLEEKSKQCQERGDLRQTIEYLQASLEKDYEAKALMEEYIRVADGIIEEYSSDALKGFDSSKEEP